MDKAHCTYKEENLYGIGIIIRVKPFVNIKYLSNLYHAFIYPYLLYCSEVWRNFFFFEKDFIEKSAKKLQLFT